MRNTQPSHVLIVINSVSHNFTIFTQYYLMYCPNHNLSQIILLIVLCVIFFFLFLICCWYQGISKFWGKYNIICISCVHGLILWDLGFYNVIVFVLILSVLFLAITIPILLFSFQMGPVRVDRMG